MMTELTIHDLCLEGERTDWSALPAEGRIVGQDKAMEALRLGFAIDRPGYNIFISGDEGSGRLTAVRSEVEKLPADSSKLKDAAYCWHRGAHNSPICITFEKGKARRFAELLRKAKDDRAILDGIRTEFPGKRIEEFISSLPDPADNPDAWKINIVLDRTGAERRPLVIETHPSHDSLFGWTEKDRAPHLSVEVGSYQKASGGFLVINAEELLAETGLWTKLKRYIKMSEGAVTSSAYEGELIDGVRPAPIPLLTKVILIGSDNTFDDLAEKDPMFLRLFKISPEFDYQMERNGENIRGTVSWLKKNGENLLPLDNSAYQEILRYSSWFAEDRTMLTTQLSILGDLEREADLACRLRGGSTITHEDVKEAIRKRNMLASLTEEKINREIKDGELVISLTGKNTGTVNGLAVMDRGLVSFGTPTVISATVAPGTEGIINIEHEAGLSGGIHDKGLLILEGYLRHRYARTFPLCIYAGICFEQSYAEVDGDSASAAELYALLSAIGEIPVRQDIAITGSVNQMGELQPVGGINEKIEGFYNACRTVGLTGRQGVMIPTQNISSLILPYEVEEAIEKGLFHLYAISTVDEGMELLSDMEKGERGRKGQFPVGSFNRLIEDSLRRLCQNSQKN